MSSEKVTVDLLIDGGEAKPSGAIAPQLGPTGVNLGQVVADINKATADYKGMKVPVKVIVDKKTRTYELEIGIPPASALIMKELGISKGSGTPQKRDAGNLTLEQILSITKAKRPDLLGASYKTAALEIIGTAQSLGATVEGMDPRDIQKKIQAGEYDELIEKWESANA